MTVQTLTTGPGLFSIGDDAALTAFESQVTSITLEPKVKADDPRPVLSGDFVSGDRSETWTVKGTMFQDFGSTESRTEWLFEHRGQNLPFAFVPANQAGKKITGTLTVEAVAIGGKVGEKGESDFEFPLTGAPVIGSVAGG